MRGDFDLSGYRIEGLLGAGPTGEVWLAVEEASGIQVALKRLRLDPAAGIDAVRRLVATLDSLAHPHLLRVRRIEGDPTEPTLVCDFAESGSLAELLRSRDRLDPGEAVTVVGPIAEALAAVHSRGLVHGAVTPENILFTQDGRPLLADTGLWSVTETDGAASGTHGLTDPQVISGATPSPAADVYGLAASAWAALTATSVTDHRPALLSVNPGIPPGLAHAVESGLQDDPALRPGAEQFADMIYASAAPVAVRFPIGLVLNDPTALTSEPAQDPLGASDGGAVAAALGPAMGDGAPTQRAGGTPTDRAGHGGPEHGGAPVPAGGIAPSDRRPTRLIAGRFPLTYVIFAGVAALVLIVVVVGGVALSRLGHPTPVTDPTSNPTAASSPGGDPSSTPSASATSGSAAPTAASGDWTAVLDRLMATRSQAFGNADSTALDAVFVDGSPAMRYDQAEMAKLTGAGAHAENLTIAVTTVSQEASTGDTVTLTAVTRAGAYDIVQADGTRTHHPAQAPKSAPIVLHKADDGTWRIYRW